MKEENGWLSSLLQTAGGGESRQRIAASKSCNDVEVCDCRTERAAFEGSKGCLEDEAGGFRGWKRLSYDGTGAEGTLVARLAVER